jgi:hypothetical protein
MGENLYNYKILTNGDMSGNLTSAPVDLSKTDGYSVYAEWSGSPVGTMKLQVSLDGIHYVDYTGSQTPVNGVGNVIWEVTTAFYDNIRVVYTYGSGSGTLNVQINGKGDLIP